MPDNIVGRLDDLYASGKSPDEIVGELNTPKTAFQRNCEALIAFLTPLGAKELYAEFDGGGDSGSIHTSHPLDQDGNRMMWPTGTVNLVSRRINYNHDTRSYEHFDEESDVSPASAWEAIVYDYIEGTGVDWYNNDGGYGEMTVSLADRTVSCEINVRETISHLEHFTDGEPI